MTTFEDETILPLWDPRLSYARPPSLPTRPFQRLPPAGSYDSDRYKDEFNMLWGSFNVFMQWKKHQEETLSVRWVTANRDRSTSGRYLESIKYVCNRAPTGGEKHYVKQHPERIRKIPGRKLGESCPATIFVKTYPGTTTVLGRYNAAHSHLLGNENLKFLPLSDDSKRGILAMAMEERSTEHIVQKVRQGTFNILAPKQKQVLREELTTRRSVQYYQAKARAKIDRLHKEDANSVAEWVRNLAKTDSVLLFKGATDPPPDGSRVEADAFILIIQSKWQRKVWESIGQNYFGTDGTHNVTKYENTNLYTIMGRDEFGRGVPISYMLASNGQQATHELYFQTFRDNNPTLPPYIIMDRDLAAFNAARVIYHDVKTLLCLFHLVSAWWKHIVVSKHQATWKLALRLSRATTQVEFDSVWREIKANGPPNFVSYMEETWLREPYLSAWTLVNRQNRTLLQQQDTTNIVESYHHVLKYMFFGGFCNRRVDTVLHTLTERLEQHYKTRRLRQELGFEGADLENRKRRFAELLALKISDADVERTQFNDTEPQEALESDLFYSVKSQSDPELSYLVDLGAPLCSCPFFIDGGIEWCKHLGAARRVHEYTSGVGGAVSTVIGEDNSGSVAEVPPRSTGVLVHDIRPREGGDDVEAARNLGKDAWWDSVTSKLRFLATMPLSQPLTIDDAAKVELSKVLERLIHQMLPTTVTLPPKAARPPRVRAATETSQVLPNVKKRAAHSQYGPYSMGEASGKKAKNKTRPQVPPPQAPSDSLPSSAPTLILPLESISLPFAPADATVWQRPHDPTPGSTGKTQYSRHAHDNPCVLPVPDMRGSRSYPHHSFTHFEPPPAPSPPFSGPSSVLSTPQHIHGVSSAIRQVTVPNYGETGYSVSSHGHPMYHDVSYGDMGCTVPAIDYFSSGLTCSALPATTLSLHPHRSQLRDPTQAVLHTERYQETGPMSYSMPLTTPIVRASISPHLYRDLPTNSTHSSHRSSLTNAIPYRLPPLISTNPLNPHTTGH